MLGGLRGRRGFRGLVGLRPEGTPITEGDRLAEKLMSLLQDRNLEGV